MIKIRTIHSKFRSGAMVIKFLDTTCFDSDTKNRFSYTGFYKLLSLQLLYRHKRLIIIYYKIFYDMGSDHDKQSRRICIPCFLFLS